LGNLLLLPNEPDAKKSLGGVLLKQPSATHAKPLKISTPRSSYDLSWTEWRQKSIGSNLNIQCFGYLLDLLLKLPINLQALLESRFDLQLRAIDPEHCVPRKTYQDCAVKSVKPRRQNIA
jgi:hypothetical protein